MRQLSCLYNKYHWLSGGRGTRGTKSGPVTGLVREARPVGKREEGCSKFVQCPDKWNIKG